MLAFVGSDSAAKGAGLGLVGQFSDSPVIQERLRHGLCPVIDALGKARAFARRFRRERTQASDSKFRWEGYEDTGMAADEIDYSLGASVRVSRGTLAGLKGVIVGRTEQERDCVLEIDGWPQGAYLALHSSGLEPCPPSAALSSISRSGHSWLPDSAAS